MTIHIVVRAAGERTAELASSLVREHALHGASTSVVAAGAFEHTLRASFESGIDASLQWTVTVDADVLIRKGALEELLTAAENMPESYFHAHGVVLDKISGVFRSAGNRIYRTALLRDALRQLPAAGERIRPESYVIDRMSRQGHASRHLPIVVGLHDFEQGFGDLYAKSFVHGQKHRSQVLDLLARSGRLRDEDQDFEVIIAGLIAGIASDRRAQIDRAAYAREATAVLTKLGLAEKAPLRGDVDVAGILATALPPRFSAQDHFGGSVRRLVERIRRRVERDGLGRGLVSSIGAGLAILGDRLDHSTDEQGGRR